MIFSGVPISDALSTLQLILITIGCVAFRATSVVRLAVITEQGHFLARRQVTVGVNPRRVFDGVLVVVDDDVVSLDPCLIERYEGLRRSEKSGLDRNPCRLRGVVIDIDLANAADLLRAGV